MKSGSRKESIFFILIGSTMSILMFYGYFSNDSDTDVIEKKGVFSSYNFFKTTSRKSHKEYLSIVVDNSKYNIPSYVHASFDLKNFKKEVSSGDSVTYYIDEEEKLLQIKKGQKSYFDEDMRSDLENNNSFVALILGIVFSIFTIMFIVKYFRG
ncbi:MAG: hypothetical protein AB8B65_13585 [Kordia sp.]|uniref:hypothetical protein n=1 Tax=Kordia sp. TaxID=1965332 RepID=UPI00385F9C5F